MSEQSREFLEKFFANTQFKIELRTFAPSTNGNRGAIEDRVFSRDMGELVAFITKKLVQKKTVYFGCCTRDGIEHEEQEGKKTLGGKINCREITAFWCDIDAKAREEQVAVLARIDVYSPAPSIVIHSGGGFHLYWLLPAPIAAHDPRVEPILKRLAADFAADKSCAELARVLRPPGTKNFKKEYGEPQDVILLREDWDKRYRIEDFPAGRTAYGVKPAEFSPVESNGRIPLGKRYPFLVSRAGGYRHHGDSEAEIFEKLKIDFLGHCADAEWNGVHEATLKQIARGVGGYQPGNVAEVKEVKAVSEVGLNDMPEAVLDGRLGELCNTRMLPLAPLAYAWPALTACAAIKMLRSGDMRANLYTALVGPVHSSKSRTGDHAAWLLGLDKPQLVKLMAGSAEGMLKELDREPPNGDDRLIAIDELGHLLEKSRIEGSSFPYILNRAYYDDRFIVAMARGKSVEFACRLSILGGIVDEKFEDCFASNTTGGLYDRFLFGLCPSGFVYDYRPFEGEPAQLPEPVAVKIDPAVWSWKSALLKQDSSLNPRVIENALRIATICAAFDGRRTLEATALDPALATIQYQTSVRKFLVPNAGRNFEGILAAKFLTYLDKHAPSGEWVSRSRMLQITHAYEYGPSISDKAISSLEFNAEIETGKAGKQRVLRRIRDEL
jgi:hypothetical protein